MVFMADIVRAPARASATLRALRVELADLPADVFAEPLGVESGELPPRLARAARLAAQHGAIAVVWIDRADHGDLLVNFYDPKRGEVLARQLESAGSEGADLDAAAVVVRASTLALLHGRSLADPPPPPERPTPPPPPPPPQAPPTAAPPAPRGIARLAIDYSGNRYAPTLPWQNGLHLAATYLFPVGGYLGVGYLLTSELSLRPYSLGGDDFVDGLVRRRPFELLTGYHRRWGRIGVEAEFGAALDVVVTRTSVLCIDDAGDTCSPSADLVRPDRLRVALGFVPRLRVLFVPHPLAAIFVGGGVDLYSDTRVYATCTTDSPPTCENGILLAPYNIRPVIQAGLLFLL